MSLIGPKDWAQLDGLSANESSQRYDAAVSLLIKHAPFKINGCDWPVTNRTQGQMKPELVDPSGSPSAAQG